MVATVGHVISQLVGGTFEGSPPPSKWRRRLETPAGDHFAPGTWPLPAPPPACAASWLEDVHPPGGTCSSDLQTKTRETVTVVWEKKEGGERGRGGRKLTLDLLLQSSDTSFVSLE